MSLFISYSHTNREFVDKLATHLIYKKINVWLDRWELNVGDSITERVQTAISEASNLLVVLSKASVESNWCKREINAGLILELEKKNVVVMPVLIEDCEIPLFLKDKLYADFRKDFDTGLNQVVDSLTSIKQESTGRVDVKGKYFTDFSCSRGIRGDHYELHVDIVNVSYDTYKPFTVLCNMIFVGNDIATKKFYQYQTLGKPEILENIIFLQCVESPDINNMMISLSGKETYNTNFKIAYQNEGIIISAFISIKMLGKVPGKNQLFYLGNTFVEIWDNLRKGNIV
ncbi:MAG TPA: toll/interleukin-1 receptor domain-containing protein [Chitinophagaceae bacterium]|nr:toll/interleukin-1 receptor domain-containing protein [Chitinophagaceae bacterium]